MADQKSISSLTLNPMRDRRAEILKKAISIFAKSDDVGTNEEKSADLDAPEGSMEEGKFLSFVSSSSTRLLLLWTKITKVCRQRLH